MFPESMCVEMRDVDILSWIFWMPSMAIYLWKWGMVHWSQIFWTWYMFFEMETCYTAPYNNNKKSNSKSSKLEIQNIHFTEILLFWIKS